ncbi:uncharacterized protein B0P05DRAFT_602271 [Gilbertella persicaria]|uniref:uncharacterized protein n=1 Tax=Gilbertella persicaria TaxID=101096 RepID=UPI00222038A9|nr:uncharacterized protein B0P05DRAFT_602271 [Gilbertella persicaria]KAI8091083.1 hypothetical protein B0P05DRAFT_602271 [Gilbertella persicaria]
MVMPSSMQMQSISGIITQIHVTIDEVPPALVGASINVIDDKVYVFAGRLATSRKMTNFLYVLDLNTLCWSRHIPPPDSDKPPKARYFHSASVYQNQLIVFGGMGYSSRMSAEGGLAVLDDVAILDIETMCWKRPTIQPSLYSPQSRYAHLSAVIEDKLVVMGGQDIQNNYLDEINVLNLRTFEWEQVKTLEKHVGAYRSIAVTAPTSARFPIQPQHEDISTEETATDPADTNGQRAINVQSEEDASPIYLYTNYNFSDVKRELQLIYSSSQATQSIVVEEYSNYMNGSTMPPGLRFPTGHTLGNHLILAGTYLSPQSQSYTIWSLDLTKLTWSRIETGSVFTTGSWNKGVLHERSNRFLVFGNSNRRLMDDYNHRQINFDHLAMVDLEAFGVYALPKATCSSLAQEMGLRLLNEPAVSDFHIITQDNISIPVNSAVLCQRWPYFARLMKHNVTHGEELVKSHYMSFPYPHTVVIALLQFVYTDNLLTAQQYQPHILSQLLLLSDMYDIPRLCELTTHALHQMLNMSTAPLIFETAALSHQTSLQIRALKMMIAAKKMIQQQQQQTRSRTVSTPTHMTDQPPPVSPTTSVSSREYVSSNTASPTLQSFRVRKPSLTSNHRPTPPSQKTKEKKKKKAFLEAFGKLSSISK